MGTLLALVALGLALAVLGLLAGGVLGQVLLAVGSAVAAADVLRLALAWYDGRGGDDG